MAANPFLRAICESPDDDLPRLVYADWLETQGDIRGEFIRVQCELAKCGPCNYANAVGTRESCGACYPPYCTECRKVGGRPKRDDLRRRERELLFNQQKAWCWTSSNAKANIIHAGIRLTVIESSGVETTQEFRRGFIESVTLSATDWLRHADQLTAEWPIRRVTLTDRNLSIETMDEAIDNTMLIDGPFRRYVPYRPQWRLAGLSEWRQDIPTFSSDDTENTPFLWALNCYWPRIHFTLPEPRATVSYGGMRHPVVLEPV